MVAERSRRGWADYLATTSRRGGLLRGDCQRTAARQPLNASSDETASELATRAAADAHAYVRAGCTPTTSCDGGVGVDLLEINLLLKKSGFTAGRRRPRRSWRCAVLDDRDLERPAIMAAWFALPEVATIACARAPGSDYRLFDSNQDGCYLTRPAIVEGVDA